MINSTFCHLHVHNEYSFLDGYGTAEQYVKRAKQLEFKYLALTNHANIDGLIKFQQACDKENIEPVLGCELYIVDDMKQHSRDEKRGHIVLLVKDEGGWHALCRLLTKANLEGFYKKARIDFDTLLDEDLSGLVITTACIASFIAMKNGNTALQNLREKSDVYLEVMPHYIGEQKIVNNACLSLSRQHKLSLVATNDCHYVLKEDRKIHEVLLAIQTKAKWNDPKRWKFQLKGLYMKTADEMIKAFRKQGCLSAKEYLMAMKNTTRIARKCCKFRIPKQEILLPKLKIEKTLRQLCTEGYKSKNITNNEYIHRANEELKLIESKKFESYFLIVWELVNWCKSNKIMIGAGRGSVNSSLVAYLLGITSVDPIKYNLLFSRFISKDRIDMPDIDMDFEDTKRDSVRDHLEEIYGSNNVAGVSTFMRMKGRAVIRDVARVFDVPYLDVDEFAKVMSSPDAEDKLVEKFSEITNEGKRFKRKYPKVVNFAIQLEGQIRGAGQHAAAVVISSDDLTKGTRGNLCKRKDVIMSNWNMEDNEYVGLIKLDILGLNTLSVLNEAKRLVDEEYKKSLDFEKIPLDDKKVLDELTEGNTVGIFQLFTWASTELCKRMGINCFEDIVAALALIRPGATDSGMTEDYIRRKHGAKWKHKNRIYENITKDTFGTVIYQEQVMKIIHEMAGLDYSMADKIRKVIGKKRNPKEFKRYKKSFIKGCLKQKTFSEDEAQKFWKGLLTWANYGFNRAHAVAYAMMAYWTAWVKITYPTQFMCASLTYGSDKKKDELVEEAKRFGLVLMPPKIGISYAKRWGTDGKHKLYIPFIEIKGVGEKMAEKCVSSFKKKQLKNRGFFDIEEDIKKTKLEKILYDIKAFDKNIIDIKHDYYFSFNIEKSPSFDSIIIKKGSFCNERIIECKKCNLIDECRSPVLPSSGKFNVMIIGESPGKREDERGKGFVGKAGQLLWRELDRYSYHRSFFHVSNAVRCYPSKMKTPQKENIEACHHWLEEEIRELKCQLILSLGNIPLESLTERKGGIMKLNGTMGWNPKCKAWICYSIHPASVLRNSDNETMFKEAIKFFAKQLKKGERQL